MKFHGQQAKNKSAIAKGKKVPETRERERKGTLGTWTETGIGVGLPERTREEEQKTALSRKAFVGQSEKRKYGRARERGGRQAHGGHGSERITQAGSRTSPSLFLSRGCPSMNRLIYSTIGYAEGARGWRIFWCPLVRGTVTLMLG